MNADGRFDTVAKVSFYIQRPPALGPKQTSITPNERRQCTAFSCSAASGETGALHAPSDSGLLYGK